MIARMIRTIKNLRIVLFLFLFYGSSCYQTIAYAWQHTGHQLTALLAYRQLQKDDRHYWLALLKHHPRFQQDFIAEMPLSIRDAANSSTETWLFLHAAVWPDKARHLPENQKKIYHRADWHYINKPIFLDARAARNWKHHAQSSDILRALNQAVETLVSKNATSPEKALSLCWLLHLVGDIHMPLHAATLVSTHLFPQGDAGGGAIYLQAESGSRQNLHGFWDALPGVERELKDINRKLDAWLITKPLVSGVGELTAERVLPFAHWAFESHQLAAKSVYDTAIMRVIRQAEQRGQPLDELPISIQYYEKSLQRARHQVITGGYRLGEVLKNIRSWTAEQ